MRTAPPSEIVAVEPRSGQPGVRAAIAIDPAGGVAYASQDTATGDLRLVWDRNDDGDFDDTIGGVAERTTVVNAAVSCAGLDFDASGRLVVIVGTDAGTTLYRDLDGNGQPNDPGEAQPIDPGPAQLGGCDVDAGGNLALVLQTPSIQLRIDRNGDGDFGDASETVFFTATATSGSAITRLSDGTVAFVTDLGIALVPGGP